MSVFSGRFLKFWCGVLAEWRRGFVGLVGLCICIRFLFCWIFYGLFCKKREGGQRR